MSTTWTSVSLGGQPQWSVTSPQNQTWQRIPSISNVTGYGFGQGGFGQGGFGGGGQQNANPTPVWTVWTTD